MTPNVAAFSPGQFDSRENSMIGAGLVQDTGALRTSGVDFVTNQLNSLDHSVMTTGGGGDTGGNFKRGKKMAT